MISEQLTAVVFRIAFDAVLIDLQLIIYRHREQRLRERLALRIVAYRSF